MALLEFRACGRDYGRQVLSNTRALASALKHLGFVVLGGTDGDNSCNPSLTLQQRRRTCAHQIILDLEASFSLSQPGTYNAWSARAAAERLRMEAGILVTPQELPLDNSPAGATGLRLATAVLTRRGFVEADMCAFAQAFGEVLHLGPKRDDSNALQNQADASIRKNLQKVLKGSNGYGNASYCYFSLDEGRPMVVPKSIVVFPMTKYCDDADYVC